MRACALLVLLFTALATAQTAPDESASSSRASIAGVVLNAATGDPVRKATVTLQNEGGFTRAIQTDVDGTFQFADLPAGGNTSSAFLSRRLSVFLENRKRAANFSYPT